MALPSLDVSKITHGNSLDRQEFEQGLLSSLQSHGFVKLVKHGLNRDSLDQLMEWSRRFFRLDLAVKNAIVNQKGLNPQRGYSGIGGENLKGFALDNGDEDFVDVKEHFDQGPRDDTTFPNQWPPETQSNSLVGFREFMEDYFDEVSNLSLKVLTVLENALKIPAGTLTARCNRGHNELRLNYYPATTIESIKNGHVRRSGAHTDYGVLTFLVQDTRGGLEIQDRSATDVQFMPVNADDPYALVVNVADTLQRWTNGVVPAGLHRVALPEKRQQDTSGILPERHSVAFFMKGNRDTSVGAMPEFVSEKVPSQYEDITAIDYHKQRHAILYT